jgi:archaellum component FlaF (FlaF/FlaG flagellin family)
MKKFLFSIVALSLLLIASNAIAQQQEIKEKGLIRYVVPNTDTTTNADTTSVTVLAIGSHVVSIDAAVVLVSGTIGGKVYMWGRTGVNWNLLDSSSTITTGTPFKTFLFDRAKYTYYGDYKFEYRTTGTQRSYLVVTPARRPDED